MAAMFEVAAIVACLVPVKDGELEYELSWNVHMFSSVLVMVDQMVDDVAVGQYFFAVIKALGVMCLLPMKK